MYETAAVSRQGDIEIIFSGLILGEGKGYPSDFPKRSLPNINKTNSRNDPMDYGIQPHLETIEKISEIFNARPVYSGEFVVSNLLWEYPRF